MVGTVQSGRFGFDPRSIADLKLWLRGDGPMYTDTGRTTLITSDGQSIAAWDDDSGTANHLTQGTAGKRPTFKTAILNGRSIARFDGGDTLVTTGASGMDVASFTALAVIKRSAATDQGPLVVGSTGSTGNRYMRVSSDKTRLVKENVADVAVGATNVGTAAWRTQVWQHDNSNPNSPTVIANTSTYDAFGVMFKLSNGTLMYIYRQGALHIGATDFGIIRQRTSTDNGTTWSAATTLFSEALMDLRNCAGGTTPSGRMVLFYGRYNGTTWQSNVYRYSDDDGANWSSETTLSQSGYTLTAFSPHGALISTEDGQLLCSWYGNDATTFYSFVTKSSDNGATWGAPILVISGLASGSSNTKFTEACFAPIGNGEVIGLVRCDNGTTFTQVKSTDHGATWASQGLCTFDTWLNSDPNTPPWLVVFGQRVYVFYAQRVNVRLRVARATTAGLSAASTNWANRADIVTFSGNDFGYPSVVPATNGRLVGAVYRGATAADADLEAFSWPNNGMIYLDGNVDGNGGTRQSFNSGANVWLASERDLAEYVNGDIAELLYYARALSLDEINAIGAYLSGRWATTWQ